MKFINESWKAILGFLGIAVGQLLENLVTSDGQVVLPQSQSEWITLLLTALGGAVAIYVVPNARNKDQVNKDVEKLDADATEEVATKALQQLPEAATERVIVAARPPATND